MPNLLIWIRTFFHVRKITIYSLADKGFPQDKRSVPNVTYKIVSGCVIHVMCGYPDENLVLNNYLCKLLSTFFPTEKGLPT